MDTMAPAQPVQIIASSEDETPGAENATFYLKEKALAEILNKVPKDMLVSVVSVVGAFRTGKSFLLTLFLRYLRARSEHSSSGGGNGDWDNDVENWLHAEGDSVLEGNNNKRGGGGGGEGGNGEDSTSSSTSAAEGSGGFAWRGGQERMTTGIWMWSEPFTHYCAAAGKEVAVLLMDTQGMFDNETTMALTAQIFGISTLVSSFQIYNVQNSIGEDKLMHLALFSEYGRIALQPPKEEEEEEEEEEGGGVSKVTGGSSSSSSTDNTDNTNNIGKKGKGDNNNNSSSSSSSSTEEEERPFEFKAEVTSSDLKPFQTLLFLVRDWTNFDSSLEAAIEDGVFKKSANSHHHRRQAVEEGLLQEMRAYFRTVIGVRGQADLQSTRDQIARCFESVSSFLLPHPGAAVTKKTYGGGLSVLEEDFKQLVGLLVRNVFQEQLEPKRVHTRNITAPELLAFFRVYTDLFRGDAKKFPPAMTMLDATAAANNRNAYDLAFTKYKESMDAGLGNDSGSSNNTLSRGGAAGATYLSPPDLRALHDEAVMSAWNLFKGIANMGSPQAIETLGLKLNNDIKREYSRAVETNDLRNPYRALEYYFIPIIIAVGSWFLSLLLHYTCSHDKCVYVKGVLNNVFGYLLVIGMVVFWQHIRMALKHLGLMLNVGAGADGNSGSGGALGDAFASIGRRGGTVGSKSKAD